MNTFRDVITAFGGAREFAGAVGANLYTVRSWRQRDSIPAEWWVRVVAAADAAGVSGVSLDALAMIAHDEKRNDAAA